MEPADGADGGESGESGESGETGLTGDGALTGLGAEGGESGLAWRGGVAGCVLPPPFEPAERPRSGLSTDAGDGVEVADGADGWLRGLTVEGALGAEGVLSAERSAAIASRFGTGAETREAVSSAIGAGSLAVAALMPNAPAAMAAAVAETMATRVPRFLITCFMAGSLGVGSGSEWTYRRTTA